MEKNTSLESNLSELTTKLTKLDTDNKELTKSETSLKESLKDLQVKSAEQLKSNSQVLLFLFFVIN